MGIKEKAISTLANYVASHPGTNFPPHSNKFCRTYLYEPHLVWPILVGEIVESEHTSHRIACRLLAEIFGVDLKGNEDFL